MKWKKFYEEYKMFLNTNAGTEKVIKLNMYNNII
jgi:hypothetical protein